MKDLGNLEDWVRILDVDYPRTAVGAPLPVVCSATAASAVVGEARTWQSLCAGCIPASFATSACATVGFVAIVCRVAGTCAAATPELKAAVT